MREIDEIRIEGEEDGWHLVLHLADPDTHAAVRYRIGLPDQFKAEVDRTIGAWLAEGERARAAEPLGLILDREHIDIELAYDTTDPKHPKHHQRYAELDD